MRYCCTLTECATVSQCVGGGVAITSAGLPGGAVSGAIGLYRGLSAAGSPSKHPGTGWLSARLLEMITPPELRQCVRTQSGAEDAQQHA